ncbi:MAG: HAD-IC family P-type ATPase, partial [Persicimonas sp.]
MRRLKPDAGQRSWLESLANLFGHRHRRIRQANGRRLHVELRDVKAERFDEYAAFLEDACECREGIEWVRINGHLARAVVSYRSALVSPAEIVALIEGIERHCELQEAPFSGPRPEHPADVEPVARKLVDIGADAAAVMLSVVLEVVGYDPPDMGFDLAAVMNVVENTPRLRERLEERFGAQAVDVGFGSLNSFVQAIGTGPIGPFVDLLFQVVKLRGERARKRVWHRREPELCYLKWDRRRTPVDAGERPQPLPEGLIEAYADEAWFASIGGFVVGLADTHNLQESTSPLFGGLPKAARYGRHGFDAELIRVFAERDLLTLVPSSLSVMDRIDTVVVDADLLFTGELLVGAVEPMGEADAALVTRRAHELFDARNARRPTVANGWSLRPVDSLGEALSSGVRRRIEKLQTPYGPLLALQHDGALCALVQTRAATDPGAEQLLTGARRANLRVVIASRDKAAAASLGPDEVVANGSDLVKVVRAQQRDGAVVALVATGPSVAMAAADLAIGLPRGPDGPPWAADILCDGTLDGAAFVLEACARARRVCEQSVGLAGLGAAIATFLSLRGLHDTEPGKVMLGVNAVSLGALANGVRHAAALADEPRPPRRDPTPWHSLEVDEVLERLDADPEGLDDEKAQRRRDETPEPASRTELVARAIGTELANPFTPILAAAAGVSAVIGSVGDAAMIGTAMTLNGVVGGVERYRAEEAVARLEERESESARVIRGGKEVEVKADQLVPGDVVSLVAGDVVPADCRIIEARDLEVDESSLTGESLPVEKGVRPSYAAAVAERRSMLYAETSIAAGRARAVVVAVGSDTEARRGVLAGPHRAPAVGVEERLEELTDVTVPIAGFSGLFLVTAGLARDESIERLVDVGVGMAVGAVPEGLPILSTVSQLSASSRLSEHGVLVRNPRAVEGLGRVDVVCADKTGTLTEGRIVLDVVDDGERSGQVGDAVESWQAHLLAGALRASPAAPEQERELPHPTDRAVVNGARGVGVDECGAYERWERLHELPFEPGRGYHAVLGRT